jgi:ribonuclease VapC
VSGTEHLEYILDASALLAVLLGEPGEDVVREAIDRAYIHSVNLAEVVAKLAAVGAPREEIESSLAGLQLPVEESFPQDQAVASAWIGGDRSGLSLGDRICLTVAEWHGSCALTADRRWTEVARRERVKLIRP